MQTQFKVGDLVTRVGHQTVNGTIRKLENGYAEVTFEHARARSTLAFLPVEQLVAVEKPAPAQAKAAPVGAATA